MNVKHIATVAAYPLKDGGFRGAIINRETKARSQSDVCDTLEAAIYWAKKEAFAYNGSRLAPLRRKGEYYANVWINC